MNMLKIKTDFAEVIVPTSVVESVETQLELRQVRLTPKQGCMRSVNELMEATPSESFNGVILVRQLKNIELI